MMISTRIFVHSNCTEPEVSVERSRFQVIDEFAKGRKGSKSDPGDRARIPAFRRILYSRAGRVVLCFFLSAFFSIANQVCRSKFFDLIAQDPMDKGVVPTDSFADALRRLLA